MTKYKLKKGFIIQKAGDKITIFDGEKSLLYTFNDSATFIFSRIKAGESRGNIIEALIKKYEIKKDVVEKDLDELIKDLLSNKILIT